MGKNALGDPHSVSGSIKSNIWQHQANYLAARQHQVKYPAVSSQLSGSTTASSQLSGSHDSIKSNIWQHQANYPAAPQHQVNYPAHHIILSSSNAPAPSHSHPAGSGTVAECRHITKRYPAVTHHPATYTTDQLQDADIIWQPVL